MTQIGTVELLATIDTSKYKKGAQEIEQANSSMEKSGDNSSSKMNSAFMGVAKVGLAAIAAAAVAVGALIVSNFSNAIKRVDTLNNSARTFENMGFTAKDVDGAMKALDKSIKGLPTSLDEAVRGVQMIAASTNDVGKSQKIFAALNNGIIGFGGSAADVTNAVLQMSQAFAGGKIDAQTWNSMLNSNLGPALNAIARDMGKTTKQLKEGLSDGSISVEAFQNALIKMNEQGGGGMKSFEKISKDATSGIGTGWANLNTSITRGIASIISAVGSEKISTAFSNVGKSIESALKGAGKIIATFTKNADLMETSLYILSGVIVAVLIPAFIALGAAIWTATAPLLPFIAIGIAIGALALVIRNNWSKIKPVVDTVTAAFIGMYNWIQKTAQPFIDYFKKEILPILKEVAVVVVQQLTTAWNTFKDAMTKLWVVIAPYKPELILVAKILGGALLVAIGLVVAGFLVAVTVVALVVAAIATLISWIAQAIAWFARIQDTASKAWWGMYGDVLAGTNATIGAIANFINRAIGGLQYLAIQVQQIGYNIMMGLWRGIQNGAANVLDGVRAIADRIKETFASALKIQSPSRVFMGFGENITQGLAMGINKGISMATSAVDGLSTDVQLSAPGVNMGSVQKTLGDSNTGSANIENNIQNIYIAKEVDGENLIKRLTQNAEVLSNGLTPQTSY